jgi:hypothetical protein
LKIVQGDEPTSTWEQNKKLLEKDANDDYYELKKSNIKKNLVTGHQERLR